VIIEKPDRAGYPQWLNKQHKIDVSPALRTYYDTVSGKMRDQFAESAFWAQLCANLHEYNDQYLLEIGSFHLFGEIPTPKLFTKPFDSFILKTYRKNVLDNVGWPGPPEAGWLLPTNCHSRVKDIVRTTLVVKYIDGVQFLVDKMRDLCATQQVKCGVSYEAREEGYYAAHVDIGHIFEVPRMTWDTESIESSVEIQVTTQLQDVIRELLHKLYESKRTTSQATDAQWQWNYRSTEFRTNYLGHTLHYL
jgi:hypothetical protein